MVRTILAVAFLTGAQVAAAEVIDEFTAAQGPYTVGPGEEISEDEGVLETETVLGGFRVLVPAIDAQAPAGSGATAGVVGGELSCRIEIAGSGANGGAGCGSLYDRGDDALFDLTPSNAFELEIVKATGDLFLAVQVFGPDETGASAFITDPTPGMTSIPFAQFMNMTADPVSWDSIDTIALTVVSAEGASGEILIDRIATDGPIENGEAVPGEDPAADPDGDQQLREDISGNYFDPARDGEGLQLTLEADGETFILTYYTYLDGEQVWLIGTGVLEDGRIVFDQMSITGGADYGDDFDSDDVAVDDWGAMTLTFLDCNKLIASMQPTRPGYEPFAVEMSRIVPTSCGSGEPTGFERAIIGNYFDPQRDGEGIQLSYEGDVWVLTFYTYLEGEQLWMIGSGERSGDEIVFPEIYVTSGADFGGRFRASDVVSTLFGNATLSFASCNQVEFELDPIDSAVQDQALDLQKIVPGDFCP